MTREIIENYRFILIPYMVNRFKEINYEGQGDSDAKEFMNDFNELCDLALKALEQEPNKDCISRQEALKCFTWTNDKGDAWNKIKLLPPATPKSKTDVLDKIRAEIEQMTPTYHNPDWSITDLVPISEVLKRIDKYKAEIEPRESEEE